MICQGHNGQVETFEDGIIISRKGVLGFLTQGLKGDKRIPYSSITAVQFKKAGMMVNGYIQFTVSGGNESRGGAFAATKDENTVMFRLGDQARQFEELCSYVQARIGAQHGGGISAADEIAKFAGLLDKGLITADEFAAKKRQLLGL